MLGRTTVFARIMSLLLCLGLVAATSGCKDKTKTRTVPVTPEQCTDLGLEYRETADGEGYCFEKGGPFTIDEAYCQEHGLSYGTTPDDDPYCFDPAGELIDEAYCAGLGLDYGETAEGVAYCYSGDGEIIDEAFCQNLGLEYRETPQGQGYCYDKASEVDCASEPDGTRCDDDDACTVNDACASGVCTGTAVDIDDDNPCTQDACDTATGEITHDPEPMNGTSCEDDDLCSNNEVCTNGICLGDYTVDVNDDPIDDGDECTRDFCDASGVRQNEPYTPEEVAVLGLGGITLEDVVNPCLEYECTIGAGETPHMNPLEGTACDDPDAGRTNGDCAVWTCRTGQCVAVINEADVESAPVTGGFDLHPACRMRECNTSSGEVTYVVDPDQVGLACDDDNICTFAEACGADGLCTGLDAAHGTECDDADACTFGDYCHEGECRSGVDLLIDALDNDPAGIIAAGDTCKQYLCDETLGVIVAAAPDGAACDDLNPCTASSLCQEGECVGVFDDTNDGQVCAHPEDECHEGYCDKGVCINFQPVTDQRACTGLNPCEEFHCGIGIEKGLCVATADVADGTNCGTTNDDCLDMVCQGGVCVEDTDRAKHEDEACGAFDDRCNDPKCDANGFCQANPLAGSPACTLIAEDMPSFGLAEKDLPCNTGECQTFGGIGACQPSPANETAVCNNGNNCDGSDWCQAGVCLEHYTTDDPNDPDYDNVAPTAGGSTECELDGDPTTVGRCKYDGTCVEISQVVDDTNDCTVPVWNETSGAVELEALADGSPCHQIPVNPCVENLGRCIDGECHLNAMPDGSPCDLADQEVAALEELPDNHRPECYAEVCIAGQCVIDTSLRNGERCDDGETTCTTQGTCNDGFCVDGSDARGYGETCSPAAASNVTDIAGNDIAARDVQCWSVFECSEDGRCSVAVAKVPDDTPCDFDSDNDTCDGWCKEGVCEGHIWGQVANASCLDDTPCTADECNGAGNCQHTALDGDVPDCQGVDPANPCDDLTCVTGSCTSVHDNTNFCDDLDVCSIGDHCVDGSCEPTGVAPEDTPCDFDHADTDCERMACDAAGACAKPLEEPDGSPCNTSDPCTTWQCDAGACVFLAQAADGTNCDTNGIPCDEGCLDFDGPDGIANSTCVAFDDYIGLLTAPEMAANGNAAGADDPEEELCRLQFDPTYYDDVFTSGHGCARFVCYYGDCRPWDSSLPADAGLPPNPTDGAACGDSGECTQQGVCAGNVCQSYHHVEDGTACSVPTCSGDYVFQPVCNAGACEEDGVLVDSCSKGVAACLASGCEGGECAYGCLTANFDYVNAFEDISGTGTNRRNDLRSPGDHDVTCGDIVGTEVNEWERLACDDGSVLLDLQDDLGFTSPDGDSDGFWFYNRRYRYISISANGAVLLHKDHPAALSENEHTLFVSGNVGGSAFDPDAGDAAGDPVNDGTEAAQIRVFRDDLSFISDIDVDTASIPADPTTDYGNFVRFGGLFTKHMPGPDGAIENGAQGNHDDYLIIQWQDAAFYGCATRMARSHMTFQMKWWPASGRIAFVYPQGVNDDGLGTSPYCVPGRTNGMNASIGIHDERGAPAEEVGANGWLVRHDSGPGTDTFDDYYLFWPTDKPITSYGWRGVEWLLDLSEFDPTTGTTVGEELIEVSNCNDCCEHVTLAEPVFVDGQPRFFLYACADGYVHFMDYSTGGDDSLDAGNATMLDPAIPMFHAAPWWSDLRLDENNRSAVYFLDEGTGLDRRLYVQWDHADYDYRTNQAGLPNEDQERGEPFCTDNADNDGDGAIDCDDASCACAAACGGRGCGLTFQLVYHVGLGTIEFRYASDRAEFEHAEASSSGAAIGFQQAAGAAQGIDLLDGRDGGSIIPGPVTLDVADRDEQPPGRQLNIVLPQNAVLDPYGLALP